MFLTERGGRNAPDRAGLPRNPTTGAAIDDERRRRWLAGMLGFATAIMLVLALLSAVVGDDGSPLARGLVGLALACAWLLALRGRTDRAYALVALAVPVGLIWHPVVTHDASDNALYLGAAWFFLLLLAPRRWLAVITLTGFAALAALTVFTDDSSTPLLDWPVLAAAGVAVSASTLLLGYLALGSTQAALREAYRARDEAAELAAELEQARRDLEGQVRERTTYLTEVLAETEGLIDDLASSAMRDYLTGLHNRRFLDEELPRQIAVADRRGTTLGLVLIDLVDFKLVNDTYSHDAGDRVLATTAKLLAATLDQGDVIARYGGDEFVVLVPEASTDRVAVLASRMRRTLAAAEFADAPGLRVGVAHGAAFHDGATSAVDRRASASIAAGLLAEAEVDLRRTRGRLPGGRAR